ncbi:TIGR03751 family conjugal transfer lipoprotein [Lampropedia puyangensis]|uniref:TIGR03751 family conjugal transfer lipoprotein n=1 Tax=Lampropedia puyangensis TaxID=1330072 RepID=A0A4S8EU70_9BURK|nr:TIGR03751 family conjugal transfer lipoprotein [Lampropedia puyangensis]THT98407.1 TIGR03751 family conjugal transfer lipoprotein [Lampropedia puyangensis]
MGLNNTSLICLALALVLGGCSVSGPRKSPLIEATAGSPTVSDIYHGRIGQTQAPKLPEARNEFSAIGKARAIGAGDELSERYWSAIEPMNQRFQRVPNPDLVMVVYPHLAKGKYPVPGYVTVFPMYDEVHYALPGEVESELSNARRLFKPEPLKQERSSTRAAKAGDSDLFVN